MAWGTTETNATPGVLKGGGEFVRFSLFEQLEFATGLASTAFLKPPLSSLTDGHCFSGGHMGIEDRICTSFHLGTFGNGDRHDGRFVLYLCWG